MQDFKSSICKDMYSRLEHISYEMRSGGCDFSVTIQTLFFAEGHSDVNSSFLNSQMNPRLSHSSQSKIT